MADLVDQMHWDLRAAKVDVRVLVLQVLIQPHDLLHELLDRGFVALHQTLVVLELLLYLMHESACGSIPSQHDCGRGEAPSSRAG